MISHAAPRRIALLSASLVISLTASSASAQPSISSPPYDNAQPAPTDDLSGAPGRGITLKTEQLSLNIRSRVQLRYQLSASAPEAMTQEREWDQLVNIGTARIWFSGFIFRPEFTYVTQLAIAGRDFRDGQISPIFDAYLDAKLTRDFNMRAGQFFVPFDRLRTVREWALQMGDRPRPVGELTLDRDVGIVAYSENFLADASPLAWRAGVFGGGGTNLTRGREPGALFLGRVELRPLGKIDDDVEGDQERIKALRAAIGLGAAYNLNTNRLRSTTGATFVGGTTDHTHLAADLVLKGWGAALQAEYLYKEASADRILSTTADGMERVEWTRSAQGWVVQTSYTLASQLEGVARASRMTAREGTDPALIAELELASDELGVGLNYYVNGHRFKLQADWITLSPRGFQLGEARHIAHVQLDVTF